MNENMEFKQLISSHIQDLMKTTQEKYGVDSSEYLALYYQYIKTEEENLLMKEKNQKHYEAVVDSNSCGLKYIERLYKRQATIDLTTVCSAHCRYCLRQNYDRICVTEKDEKAILEYLKNDKFLKEVLITGGDPLLLGEKLTCFIERIIKEAPNIRIIRIGTRLPVQNPTVLDNKILSCIYENRKKVFFEIALQVNHVIELQSETIDCINALRDAGAMIYSQNVLLKGVNSNIESLIELYDTLRYQHIESHYLFHPVPLCRTSQFRMPLEEFLNLANQLTASGEIPGRSKPMFSIMTDVGKCTLYENTIGNKDENGYYDIYTSYRLEERKRWNEGYKLPESATIQKDGTIMVKYLDGSI